MIKEEGLSELRLAVFASGSGSNLQAIIDAIKEGKLEARINLVVSDKIDAFALERAQKEGISTVYINRKDFSERGDFINRLLAIMDEYRVNFIVLAGYMKKVPTELVRKFTGRMLNIHPALVPAFCGKGYYGMKVHQAVVDYGVKVTGVTVHLVDEEYDNGAIVAQCTVKVMDDDTAESLAERVLEYEHAIYPETIQLFAADRVDIRGRKTYIKDN
ncbi:phosphoribosylglycinamide formyltransferase [bacterium]|nr:phosphoribosylglycinamide formyltransferase [bacterium]